jgi:CDP-glycerol glycerophosphotransferase
MSIVKKIYIKKEKVLMSVQLVVSYFFYHVFKIKKAKNQKIVVGFQNLYYNGNPRAVFEYMRKFPDKYDCYWIAKNRCSYLDVKRNIGKVFYMNSIIGIPQFLRTDIWVIAHASMREIPSLPHKNYKIVQLWHGIGYKSHNRKPSYYDSLDIWCTTSNWIKNRHVKLWKAPEELFQITGYPRLDRLYQYANLDLESKKKIYEELGINSDKKNIMYAPSWELEFWPWGKKDGGFERFCQYCENKNTNLIIRLHPYYKIKKKRIQNIVNKHPNVHLLNMDCYADTEKILSITDVLITDWSSISTDFLFMKKPIIFIEKNNRYLLEEKEKQVLLSKKLRSGEIVFNEEDFFKTLEICFKKNRYKFEQEKLFSKVHGKIDGGASERVVDVIEKLYN